MSILRQLFTGADNATHDLGRWSWAGSFAAVVAAAVGNWWHGVALDVQALATALGIVAGAHGAALLAKAKTEPQPEDKP
jgi:hypothetical protein